MSLIRVKCSGCGGSGKRRGYVKGDSVHFDDYCKECSGTGGALVSEDEAKSLLIQKQIDDAKL